jgi:hypothetical protein
MYLNKISMQPSEAADVDSTWNPAIKIKQMEEFVQKWKWKLSDTSNAFAVQQYALNEPNCTFPALKVTCDHNKPCCVEHKQEYAIAWHPSPSPFLPILPPPVSFPPSCYRLTCSPPSHVCVCVCLFVCAWVHACMCLCMCMCVLRVCVTHIVTSFVRAGESDGLGALCHQ